MSLPWRRSGTSGAIAKGGAGPLRSGRHPQRWASDRETTRVTLTELRYVVAVAKERHFGRAAESCFVSQPTLSVAIKKLEEELGVTLFERGGSEVGITPIG